jgi:ferredoxin
MLFAAVFTNLTLLVFDPLTILFRTLSTSVWPALDYIVSTVETALYQGIPLPGWLQSTIRSTIATFDGWIRPNLLPLTPAIYRAALLYAGVFTGIILLNIFATRFWCRYLCPLGGFLGLLSKFAIIRRKVGPECKGCTLCTRACPTGTIRPDKGYTSDPSECTVCLECLEDCPRNGISFSPDISLAEWNDYDPGRRQALMTLGLAIAGLALLRSDVFTKRETPHLIHPPGARQNDLLSKCVRCGECARACPTNAIQPALYEAGLEGLWAPILIPRLGYCDYSCNACGQVCPVQAIPPLSLDEKRAQVIGLAYLDQNRCIAWADHRDCIVCEEMCPLPEKAVWLEKGEFINTTGEAVTLQLPHVNRELCIGCGICEYKCPVNGEAAIRVFVPKSDTSL